MKKTNIDGFDVGFSSEWVNNLESRQHFSWYWCQASLVYKFCKKSDSLLEVGKGTGFLSDVLRGKGWEVKTLDIDEDKRPDYCCDAYSFDYSSVRPDVLLAFEIFEHLPFETFSKVVSKISESSVRRIIFSVPWCERQLFGVSFKFPYLAQRELYVPLPGYKIFEPNHFWELSSRAGNGLVSLERLRDIFAVSGFTLSAEFKDGRIQFFHAIKEQ